MMWFLEFIGNYPLLVQYTMLCGQAPFYNQSLTTEQIMERIRAGDFSLMGPEWNGVSNAAKDVLEGNV